MDFHSALPWTAEHSGWRLKVGGGGGGGGLLILADSPSVLMIAGRTVVGWSVRELYIYVSHRMFHTMDYGILYKYEDGIPSGSALSYNTTTTSLLLGIFRQIRLLDIFINILSYQHSKGTSNSPKIWTI